MSTIIQIFQGFGTSGTGIAPVANFTASPTTITSGGTVTFTDTSTNNPTSWLWTFGDGTTSTLRNPTHTYTGAMKYTVSLKATNGAGNNTKTVTDMITSNVAGNVVTNPAASFVFNINPGPKSIAFGAGKFVTTTGYAPSCKMVYSSDGVTWTPTGILYTRNNSTYMKSVAYGNGYFVGNHYNDYWTYYSSDGVNWSSQAVNASVGLSSVSINASNGVFLNFSSGNAPGYSTDMVNWTASTGITSFYGAEYLPAAGRWVSCQGTATRYSTNNGATWVVGPTLSGSMNYIGASAGNGSNLAVFVSNSTSYNFTATDGTTWTTYKAPFPSKTICYGNDRFIAIDGSTRLVYWSTDGINWTQFATIPGTAVIAGIAYGNGKYVVASTSSTASWIIT